MFGIIFSYISTAMMHTENVLQVATFHVWSVHYRMHSNMFWSLRYCMHSGNLFKFNFQMSLQGGFPGCCKKVDSHRRSRRTAPRCYQWSWWDIFSSDLFQASSHAYILFWKALMSFLLQKVREELNKYSSDTHSGMWITQQLYLIYVSFPVSR
jgi:hypothetical protein